LWPLSVFSLSVFSFLKVTNSNCGAQKIALWDFKRGRFNSI